MAFCPLVSHLDKNDNIWYVLMDHRILNIQINVISKSVHKHEIKIKVKLGNMSMVSAFRELLRLTGLVTLMKEKPDLTIQAHEMSSKMNKGPT